MIPLVAVLAINIVHLPASQSHTSANAPQAVVNENKLKEILISDTTQLNTDTRTSTRASRSQVRKQLNNYSNVDANQAFAKSFMDTHYSWGEKQFNCLVTLWNRESGWKHTADNPNSSAYGIPQALPGKKMSSAGKDWKTNPQTQIKWGLNYIKRGYGNPCGALGHSNKHHWY